LAELEFLVGAEGFLASDSPAGIYSALFEDDGETGYFYAYELDHEYPILDSLLVYNVANVVDPDRPVTVSIIWSESGMQCVLLIEKYLHAAFDFEKRRGYCRANFPNFLDEPGQRWIQSDHSWSEEAVVWMKDSERSQP
jgi:hypothetical protein